MKGTLQPPCNGRNDRYTVSVIDRRFQVLQEADVIPVNINVHEPSDLSRLITDPFFDSGKIPVQILYQGLYGISLDSDFINSFGEFSEWGGYPDMHAHNQTSLLAFWIFEWETINSLAVNQSKIKNPQSRIIYKLSAPTFQGAVPTETEMRDRTWFFGLSFCFGSGLALASQRFLAGWMVKLAM